MKTGTREAKRSAAAGKEEKAKTVTFKDKTMASTSETGHEKNVDNLGALIEQCKSMGARYNPSNPSLAIAKLEEKRTESRLAVKEAKDILGIFTTTINIRDAAYKGIKKLSTRVVASLKSCGAEKAIIDDVKTWHKRITGQKSEKPIALKEGEEAPKSNSVSQQSFDKIRGNFEQMVAIIKNEPMYSPNEPELKIANLEAYLQSLEPLNGKVDEDKSIYQRKIDARNVILYAEKTGLFDLAKAVKEYVKSVDSATGTVYKKVAKIRFTKPGKK